MPYASDLCVLLRRWRGRCQTRLGRDFRGFSVDAKAVGYQLSKGRFCRGSRCIIVLTYIVVQ
jgi:hypothetical protein